jgi:glutathione S-transferase
MPISSENNIMLQIYGSPFSAPTNKVRYVANYLNIPYELHSINIPAGEHKTAEFLKMNPLAKIPAINDEGFGLGESNTIIRYLAKKHLSIIYPQDLQQQALIDQWMDYATQHVGLAISKIMFNTYYYKILNVERDNRSFEDGHNFINQYLPIIEKQLSHSRYIQGNHLTLADITMLAALDACELCSIDLKLFPQIHTWQLQLMQEDFYTACHNSFTESFLNRFNSLNKK